MPLFPNQRYGRLPIIAYTKAESSNAGIVAQTQSLDARKLVKILGEIAAW
jgi:hypothetical protein